MAGSAETEFEGVAQDFRKFQQEMKDPLVVGALLSKLHDERRSTNLLFKQLVEKFDRFESRLASIEEKFSFTRSPQQSLLGEVDEEIVAFVRKKARVCADDVQAHFKYKGSNAASARLNQLVRAGLLEKTQAGRKVWFLPKSR